MEFLFNVDLLLPDKISKFNNKLQIKGKRPVITDKSKRSQLLMIIDEMGAASAKAQGLHIAVTTGDKFVQSEHVIYLMKDECGDKSAVVGILKMGVKKLFLINQEGTQNETLPLCVLDFYVHESKQRIGYGKQLYDFMLKEENILPHFLAIDRPSSKFLAFLRKHYNLFKTIPQVNHFTIFDDFFENRHVIRRNSTEQESNDSSTMTGRTQCQPLSDAPDKYPKKSYPYRTEYEKDFKIHSKYEYDPQRHGNASASTQSLQFNSKDHIILSADSAGAIHAKLTPDGSCASHLLEDSAMKIFGVPSAWLQTSGR
uniref:Alpha-tubulin N-acetyltransferase n=1 Tax=Strigamia maritima TaxID=126957 RepID=T1IJR1_STRMM